MKASPLRYFFIKISSTWAEIRVGASAPTLIEDSVDVDAIQEHTFTVRTGRKDLYGYDIYGERTTKKKVKYPLKHSRWEGGEVLGQYTIRNLRVVCSDGRINKRDFYHYGFTTGNIVEITDKTSIEHLSSEEWRDANLYAY